MSTFQNSVIREAALRPFEGCGLPECIRSNIYLFWKNLTKNRHIFFKNKQFRSMKTRRLAFLGLSFLVNKNPEKSETSDNFKNHPIVN